MSILNRIRGFIARNTPSVLYWREVIRPTILKSPPVTELKDNTCEVHSLVSTTDFLNLFWSLKSFYLHSGKRYCLCVHDDGTLTPEQISTIKDHFPDSRVVERSEADRQVAEYLSGYPKLQAFRSSNHFAVRLTDFPFMSKSEQILQLDTDVLFHANPEYLIDRIEDCDDSRCFANRDVATAYNITAEEARDQFGIELMGRLNAGLALLQMQSLDPATLEEFLTFERIYVDSWLVEQTLTALCASRHGVQLLPEAYDVDISEQQTTGPCRHYVGKIRHRLYTEGVRAIRPQIVDAIKRLQDNDVR